MIITHWKILTIPCVVIQGFIIFSAIYAYRVNAKRAPDDLEKKDLSPHAIWLAPVIFPILILLNIFIVVLTSLIFGVFLMVFPFALLLFRKSFLIPWILKQALGIGNEILEINTALLRAAGVYRAASI